MIILCNTLLPNDKAHAILTVFGKTIKPLPVTDIDFEVDVRPKKAIVSIASNTVFIVLQV